MSRPRKKRTLLRDKREISKSLNLSENIIKRVWFKDDRLWLEDMDLTPGVKVLLLMSQ